MPKTAYSLIYLAALTLIGFFSVDIFYRVVTDHLERMDGQKIITEKVPQTKKTTRPVLAQYRGISDRALFGLAEKPDQGKKTEEIEALEPTSLKLALLGTVESGKNTGWAVIVAKSQGKQDIYRVGDSVQEAVIKKIVRNKVILRVGDRDEILTVEEGRDETGSPSHSRTVGGIDPSASGRPARTITLRRSDIEESLQDINGILSQARIRPFYNRDKEPDGLIVTGIRGNSIFRRMGFRNGDIVRGVDGRPLTSPDDIISMYSDLKSSSNVSIQLLRRGREQIINYRFR